MNRFLTTLAAGLLLAGCGLSDGKALRDLDEDDWAKLCEEFEEESFTCEGEGFSYTIEFGGDCEPTDTDGTLMEFPESCEATVGDLRDCDEAWREVLRADPCSADVPTECDYFESCMATE